MPIYNKPPQSGIVGSNHNTADIDYHQSEAAKVKRTREQAYFNSYDFDAIEVLPYDDEDEADCNGAISQRNSHNTIGGTLKQLQQRKSSLSNKMISTIGNDPQHHHHHHQYDDFSTTSHISSSKSNNYTKQQQQQQQQYHYNNHINHYHHRHPIAQQPSATHHSYASYLGRPVAAAGRRLATIYSKNNSHHHQHHIHTNQSSSSASSTLNDDNDDDDDDDAHTIVAKPDLLTIHDNRNHDHHHHHQHLDIIKHLKLQSSSSEISSSSVSSAALELAAITKKSPSSSSSSAQKVAASGCIIDRNSIVGNCAGTVAGAGANTTVSGDFSLPRAMLKYSSTTHSNLVNATATLAAQATAAAAAATTTNAKVGTAVPSAAPAATATTGINSKSMPLATTTTTATAANSSTSTLTKQQQQKLNNTNTTNDKQAKTNGVMNTGFRPHKKFSTSSSISTIESEGIDIEIHTDAVDNGFEQRQQHQTTADVSSKQATTNPKPALSRSGSAAGATTTIVAGMRPRSASHQSHYSTDKSNSSGYYSSNVCSTYSLDEHIYCEPLNAMKTPNRKESVGSTSKQVLGQQQHPSTIITAAAAATTGAATTAKREIDSKTMQHTGAGKHSISAATTTAANSVMNTLDFARRHFRLTDRTNDIIASNKSNNNVVSNAHIGRQAQVGAGGVVGNKEFSEHLRILESSIENLDRHLKTHPASSSHHQQHDELLVGYVHDQSTGNSEKLRALSTYTHLPTIREGLTSSLRNSNNKFWSNSLVGLNDDSLLDIDLDSFLLRKDEQQKQDLKITNNKQIRRERSGGAGVGEQQQQQLHTKGIDNPSFLTEEQEENHYKCAKYINSCPEDAYRVESDILAPARSSISDQSVVISVTEDEPVALLEPSLVGASAHLFPPKRYEDQMHFQNTRELLEDVRDKIRQLTQAHNPSLPRLPSSLQLPGMEQTEADYMPRQLQSMIDTLRQELEIYLARMNQHSEREIQQLCSGLVKNQTIVKMKNAFDRRRSLSESTTNEFSISYEALPTRFGGSVGCGLDNAGIVIQQQQITSIRCTSDPNFKMKRKSLTEVFPISDCYVENVSHSEQQSVLSQLHRNLNYQKPILDNIQNGGGVGVGGSSNELNSKNVQSKLSGSNSPAGADSTEANDQESILDRHRKKPSIWEMYYGTNRRQQSLLGCANTISHSNQNNNNNNNSSSNHNNAKATKGSSSLGCGSSSASVMVSSSSSSAMCYPSSRPESDFTLDLPRAEQLRIKMEKEKKFRHRCRLITTFLSLIFFLLTVMVVSLVLTRGKRMFGSMI